MDMTDNLVRARQGGDAMGMTDSASGRTMFGHFSVFNTWTEIDSAYEGRFMEKVAPGAFTNAFKDTKQLRVLFEHGRDPSIGNKPIASPTALRQDDMGAYFEAELYAPAAIGGTDLAPALRSGQLGSSFRFRVVAQDIVKHPQASDVNPDRIPERTIKDVALYEFGPCTWGAYPDATAGVRSGTDSFIDQLMHDPAFVARFTERAGLHVVSKILATAPVDDRAGQKTPDVSTDGHRRVRTKSQRRAIVALMDL